MSGRCYFVTGAAGFVGRHLCQRLRARGERVIGLTRRIASGLEELGVEVVRGDIGTGGPWQDAVTSADCIIHCAAQATFGDGPGHAINVDGTRNVIEAINRRAVGPERFVFVSTIGAVDRRRTDRCTAALTEADPLAPTSDYGRSKAKAERLVRQSGLRYTIVRPAMVVGSDMRSESHFAVFVRMALNGAIMGRFAWPGQFSVVHVDDLAAALDLCATHPAAEGKTFFCAGTPVAVEAAFRLARPDADRLPLAWASKAAAAAPVLAPFKLKALLLPALTACDAPLRDLGWTPRFAGTEALAEVVVRERARLDPDADPGGQCVITGAASGLGRALVAKLAPRRAHVLLIDRDAAGLEAVRAAHPHCRVLVADLAAEEAVDGIIKGPEWGSYPVSELFACAGFGLRGPVLDHPAGRQAAMFKVNVLARLLLAHAALPGMIRAGFGRIVFVGSSSAFQPLPYMAAYAASNAALLSLGEAWAAELHGTGVHLMQACPGGMQTNFQRSAGVKELAGERLMPPEEVADEILQGLRRRRTTIVVSSRAHAMALLARVLPRAASVALWKRLMARLR